MAKVSPRGFTRRLSKASNVVRAVTGFLHHVADLLRQLVHVVGWLILLAGSINLLFHPHFSPSELFVPSAGSLAVLQSLLKPRYRPASTRPVRLPNEGSPGQGSRSATMRPVQTIEVPTSINQRTPTDC